MGRSLDQGFLARRSVAIIKNKPPDEIWKWKWIMRSDGRLKSPIKSRSSWHNLFDCPLAVRFENAGINLHFPLVLSPPIAHWDFIRLRMPILIYAQKQSLLFEWPANANFPPLWFFFLVFDEDAVCVCPKVWGTSQKGGKRGSRLLSCHWKLGFAALFLSLLLAENSWANVELMYVYTGKTGEFLREKFFKNCSGSWQSYFLLTTRASKEYSVLIFKMLY